MSDIKKTLVDSLFKVALDSGLGAAAWAAGYAAAFAQPEAAADVQAWYEAKERAHKALAVHSELAAACEAFKGTSAKGLLSLFSLAEQAGVKLTPVVERDETGQPVLLTFKAPPARKAREKGKGARYSARKVLQDKGGDALVCSDAQEDGSYIVQWEDPETGEWYEETVPPRKLKAFALERLPTDNPAVQFIRENC